MFRQQILGHIHATWDKGITWKNRGRIMLYTLLLLLDGALTITLSPIYITSAAIYEFVKQTLKVTVSYFYSFWVIVPEAAVGMWADLKGAYRIWNGKHWTP